MPPRSNNRSAASRGASRRPKRGRTRLSPEDRKQEIVEAAYDIFSEAGYHGSTVATIAKRVGISKGTFYLYFASKRAIFDYLVNEKLAVLLVEANAAEDPAHINSIEEHRAAVRRVGERLAALLIADPHMGQLMFFVSMGTSPELTDSVDKALEFAASLTERYFKNGVDKGFIRADVNTRDLSHGINALIITAGRQIARSEHPEETARSMLELLMTLIHDGVAVAPRGCS